MKEIDNAAFSGCTSLTSISIPNSVTSIDSNAFRDCSGLTSLTIGNNVTNIGNSAFFGCGGLTSVTSLNSTPPTIYSGTFGMYSYSTTLEVPIGCKQAYQNAEGWKNFTNIIEIDPTVVQSITLNNKGNCAPIYDLGGRKLIEPIKGINIIGGRKVLVK